MKKLFGCILSLVVAVMLVFTPAEHVYAQGLGLSVSSSSIAVGKTVKVTVSMRMLIFTLYFTRLSILGAVAVGLALTVVSWYQSTFLGDEKGRFD